MKVTNKMRLYRLIYYSFWLYMFRAMFSPIIRSTWLYLQYLVVFTQVAVGCQQLGWTLPDTVNTVKCPWWWAKTSPETRRADKENQLIYIVYLVGYFHNCITMHGFMNVRYSNSLFEVNILLMYLFYDLKLIIYYCWRFFIYIYIYIYIYINIYV